MVSRRSDAAVMAAARRRNSIVNGLAEIEAQGLLRLLGGKLAVGGEAAQIEQRRIEPGILPVHEPQPLPVIDEVGRKQIIVAEHDLDRTDGGFESRGPRQKIGEEGNVPAVAFAQRVRVVAHDMEHPEHRGGPAQDIAECPGDTAAPCRSGARDLPDCARPPA